MTTARHDAETWTAVIETDYPAVPRCLCSGVTYDEAIAVANTATAPRRSAAVVVYSTHGNQVRVSRYGVERALRVERRE